MANLNRRQLLGTGLVIGAFAATQVSRAASNTGSSYDRSLSALLVECCKLAVAQYVKSTDDRRYDGSINQLAEYPAQFDRYTQIASFQAREIDLSEKQSSSQIAENPMLENELAESGTTEKIQLPELPRFLSRQVYFGFALTSPTHNIIALRGTLTQPEWFNNARAEQVTLNEQQPQYGKVHSGFKLIYKKLDEQIRDAAQAFDPNLPCYITGHSLGAALSILAALDIAQNINALQRQLALYSFAGPRVGDPTFAAAYDALLPQSYRIVNLADVVPIIPPKRFKDFTYQHIGQEWSFLNQTELIALNHDIGTYSEAVSVGVDTNQTRKYPVSGLPI